MKVKTLAANGEKFRTINHSCDDARAKKRFLVTKRGERRQDLEISQTIDAQHGKEHNGHDNE